MTPLLALAWLVLATPAPDEIVVQAVRGKCRVTFADRTLTDREFDAHAAEWAAGKPVRVIEPRGANRKCLTKIAFRLADRGVKLIYFVDTPPPDPVPR